MSDFITATRAALAARIRELAQDEERAGLPATAAVYRECAAEVERPTTRLALRSWQDAACDLACRLEMAEQRLDAAEARHRRHLARLKWRMTQARAPSGRYRQPWESDRLLWRAEIGVFWRGPLRLSGPRPSSWEAYLAAEAAASKDAP